MRKENNNILNRPSDEKPFLLLVTGFLAEEEAALRHPHLYLEHQLSPQLVLHLIDSHSNLQQPVRGTQPYVCAKQGDNHPWHY